MRSADNRSGTALDVVVCVGIGLLATAAGLLADAAGASAEGSGGVTLGVVALGLLLDRWQRGRPAVDAVGLEGRVGYRRLVAIRTVPVLGLATWVIAVNQALLGLRLGSDGAQDLVPLAGGLVMWSVADRVVARRAAARTDLDERELGQEIVQELRLGAASTSSFAWRRDRQIYQLAGFLLLTALGLALVPVANFGGSVFGVPLAAVGAFIVWKLVPQLRSPVAIAIDPRGLTVGAWPTVPWDAVESVLVHRVQFHHRLEVLVDRARVADPVLHRMLRRSKNAMSFPLHLVDAEPGEVLAAIRGARPEVPLMFPEGGGRLEVV